MQKNFIAIACINKTLSLGRDGEQLYYIRGDLANFKRMTTGNVVIMGRNTFEKTLNSQPLAGRVNIIITSKEDYWIEPNVNIQDVDVYIAHSTEEAAEYCQMLFPDKEWFVIGGGVVYKDFAEKNLLGEMRLTIVNDDEDGDAKFPEFNTNEWYEYYRSYTQRDQINGITYRFAVLKKIEK